MTGTPASALGSAVPNPRPSVSMWTREQFVQTMRTGVRPSFYDGLKAQAVMAAAIQSHQGGCWVSIAPIES